VAPQKAAKTSKKPAQATVSRASGEAALDLAKVNQAWPRVIIKTKERKMSVGTFLSEGRLVSVAGRKIVIAFSEELAFHKETLEKMDNLMCIRECAESFLGAPIQVELILQKVEKTAEDVKEDAAAASLIENAMNIFGGRVVHRENPT